MGLVGLTVEAQCNDRMGETVTRDIAPSSIEFDEPSSTVYTTVASTSNTNMRQRSFTDQQQQKHSTQVTTNIYKKINSLQNVFLLSRK